MEVSSIEVLYGIFLMLGTGLLGSLSLYILDTYYKRKGYGYHESMEE